MIRWLSKEEWIDYIENRACMGKYISHTLLRDQKIHEPVDKYNFSDAIVKVKVNQSFNNSENSDDIIDIYFDNAGPIKIEGDDYEVDEENAEFQLIYFHPHIIPCVAAFIEMMSEKFGHTYRLRRLLHANYEISLAKDELKIVNSDMLDLEFLYGNIRTNTSDIIDKKFLNAKPHELHNFIESLKTPKPTFKHFCLTENAKSEPYSIYGKLKNIEKCKFDKFLDDQISNL